MLIINSLLILLISTQFLFTLKNVDLLNGFLQILFVIIGAYMLNILLRQRWTKSTNTLKLHNYEEYEQDEWDEKYECDAKKVLDNLPIVKFKGVPFRDINVFLRTPIAREYASFMMKKEFRKMNQGKQHHAILMESRGFLFRDLCNIKSFIVLARKPGKLPGELISTNYNTEYSKDCMEMQKASFENKTLKAYIMDDILATGGTADAIARLCVKSGVDIGGFLFLMEIKVFNGKERLEKKYGVPVYSFVSD